MVVLPEPMRPTMPTRSPGLMRKETASSAGPAWPGYLKTTLRNSIAPSTFGRRRKTLPRGRSVGSSIRRLSPLSDVQDWWKRTIRPAICPSGAMARLVSIETATMAPVVIRPSPVR
jgi:hypothetical protein